jgi:protein SCO1/2
MAKAKPSKARKSGKATPQAAARPARQTGPSVLPSVVAGLAVFLMLVAGGLVWLGLHPMTLVKAGAVGMQASPPPAIGGSFSLISDNGQLMTEKDIADGSHWHLMYFGYTSCPDECPTMLNDVALAMKKLPQATQDKIKMVFISVDPRRDTPQRLKEYLAGFDPRFEGWTGPKEELDRMTKEYLAFYTMKPMQMEGMSEADNVEISHSDILYIMGPDGKYVTHYSHEDGADALAAKLAEVVK